MVVQNRVFKVEEVKKRCTLVGLQLNADETDLLSWDVVNVAKQGDRLIAVHVSRNYQDTTIIKTPTLLKILDDFMAVHEDICIKKQVEQLTSHNRFVTLLFSIFHVEKSTLFTIFR